MIFVRLGLNIEMFEGLICDLRKEGYFREDIFFVVRMFNIKQYFIRKVSGIFDIIVVLIGIKIVF